MDCAPFVPDAPAAVVSLPCLVHAMLVSMLARWDADARSFKVRKKSSAQLVWKPPVSQVLNLKPRISDSLWGNKPSQTFSLRGPWMATVIEKFLKSHKEPPDVTYFLLFITLYTFWAICVYIYTICVRQHTSAHTPTHDLHHHLPRADMISFSLSNSIFM